MSITINTSLKISDITTEDIADRDGYAVATGGMNPIWTTTGVVVTNGSLDEQILLEALERAKTETGRPWTKLTAIYWMPTRGWFDLVFE